MNTANNSLVKSLQRLSTGLRINSAADDPAGFYVASGLNSQIRSLKTVQNNIAVGSSLLSTAEGTLGNINNMLNRLNDLALQGASSTVTDTQRGALVKEASNLVDEIKKLNRETMFNGMSVFGDMGNFSKAVANVVPSLASTVPMPAPAFSAPAPQNAPTASVSATSPPPPRKVQARAMSASAPTEPTHQTTVPSGYTAIYTEADLQNVRNNLSGKYILMNNIDMATFGNWDSIGDSSNKFTGTFDGNGYAIQNLTIDRADEDYVGLFEKTQSATIKNLGLENVDIKGNNNTGGLVGYGDGGNDIHNCYVTGNIIGSDDTGRLLGSAYGCSIANCYATGSIIGENDTGGLVGYSYKDTISNCYATGNVTGNGNIGGLMGYGNGGEVINCYTKSDVQQKDNSATSDFNILFGYMYKTTVYNVIGSSDNSTIQGTLSTGASILSEFSKNFKVLNNTEFNQASTWSDFRDDIWDKSSNVPKLKPNAPIQRIDEIEDFCINIYTIDDFDKIKTYRNFKFVLMNDIDVSSVNWAPIGDKQYKFYGTFDGNGYAIKNLKISRANESCLGLFGYTDSAIIKNLELENVNIKGDNSTGGLVGHSESTKISNCSVSGAVNGSYEIGGLVGSGDNNEITNCHTSADVTSVSHSIGGIVGKGDYIKISNCYTTGKITGGSYTGGLIGLCQFSEILNSNVTGDVTGGSSTGGLFGYTSGIISDCYSSGDVTGADCTGGLAGTTYSAKFSNCYTNSNVKMKEGLTTPYPNIGVLFGLNRSYGAMITSANNVLGNIDKSTIKTDIGGGTLTSDSSNTRVMGQTEFLTSSTWNDYDDTIWDKSEYPQN